MIIIFLQFSNIYIIITDTSAEPLITHNTVYIQTLRLA